MKQSSGPGSGAQVEERRKELAFWLHGLSREAIAEALADFERDVRADAMEQAARIAEEHTEHMDFTNPQDHHEPPFRCSIATAIRAALRRGGAEPPQGKP